MPARSDDSPLYDGLGRRELDRLYPSPEDPAGVPADSPRALPARLALGGISAALAAAGAATVVKILTALGILQLTTIGSSLALRVALPAACFVATFLAVFWLAGIERPPAEITPDMTDDEIARALKGR